MQFTIQETKVGSTKGEFAIKAFEIWKIYKSNSLSYIALRGISFTIKRGEFVGILGPSGSGKSTILNLLGMLDTPTKGELFIDSVNVSNMNEGEKTKFRNQRIGFVFQSYNLIPYLTIEENVEIPAIALGISRKERKEKARKLLDELGLQNKYLHKPREVSGGEQQRVAIARAFMNNPAIILADEPTGNLDSKSAENVITLLKEKSIENGATLVIVTHDENLTKHCNKVIRIKDGKIVSDVIRQVAAE